MKVSREFAVDLADWLGQSGYSREEVLGIVSGIPEKSLFTSVAMKRAWRRRRKQDPRRFTSSHARMMREIDDD